MRAILFGLVILTVSACGQQGLRDFRSNSAGPDEFSALPSLPLAQPASYSDLPPPTPGAANRADADPAAAAVTALGGRSDDLGGVPASDVALIAHMSQSGIELNIRATLFAEDEALRKLRGRVTVFGGDNRYYAAYAGQALDAYAEQDRFRNAGVQVPTAPPPAN